MVQVNMEDHRHEDFKPTNPKIKPFTGKGHTLGRLDIFSFLKINFFIQQTYHFSPTPIINDGSTSIAAAPHVPISAVDNGNNEKLYVFYKVS